MGIGLCSVITQVMGQALKSMGPQAQGQAFYIYSSGTITKGSITDLMLQMRSQRLEVVG